MAARRRAEVQRAAALYLKYQRGLSVRKIASLLGLASATVQDWLQQGPDRLVNPRLRMIAQQAQGQGVQPMAEADWDGFLVELHEAAPEAAEALGFVEKSAQGVRSAQKLRHYWSHGAGAAKIGWGTSGDWSRCVAELRKYIRNPEGYCQLRHKEATGAYAGHAVGEKYGPGGSHKHSELEEDLTEDQVRALHQIAEQLGVEEPDLEMADSQDVYPEGGTYEPKAPLNPPKDLSPTGEGTPDVSIEDQKLLGPGEQNWEPQGTNVPVETPPPLMDRLYLEAMHRWLNLIANDVPNWRAQKVVRKGIDPDFMPTDAQTKRAYHALGKSEEMVKLAEQQWYDRPDPPDTWLMANWSAGVVAPPDYVQRVYADFEMTPAQEEDLAELLYQMARESYASGISVQLTQVGAPTVTTDDLRDPMVLSRLQQQASEIASQIVQTFNRDLASETYQSWIEQRAERGRQMSQHHLATAMSEWVDHRSDWKATQIGDTEVNRFATQGAMDFVNQNRGRLPVSKFEILPDECVCDYCGAMVQNSPYSASELAELRLPAHPGCIHLPRPVYDHPLRQEDMLDLWMGTGEIGVPLAAAERLPFR